jgi:NAD(P)-dependent dehydrogenase (short-subunit alcohol dehydrogenase family)
MTCGTAIIVGVGPGLGLALARTFAAAGHPVALLGRTENKLDEYVAAITSDQPVRRFVADASSPESLRAGLNAAISELGGPEVLIYNAAQLRQDTPLDGDDEGWVQALAVDVLGAKIAAETVIPALRDSRGSLLFTGGGLAFAPSPEFASLSVGKAAIRAYTQALHAHLKGRPIHAATVTIAGNVDGGEERFAADVLANDYLYLHQQAESDWEAELARD